MFVVCCDASRVLRSNQTLANVVSARQESVLLGQEMTDVQQDCGKSGLREKRKGTNLEGVDTGRMNKPNEQEKRSRRTGDLRSERVVLARKGSSNQIRRSSEGEVGMDMESKLQRTKELTGRMQRIKELTGTETRKIIVEKEESRDIKKAKQEAKKMVKQGNVKSIDSYFK